MVKIHGAVPKTSISTGAYISEYMATVLYPIPSMYGLFTYIYLPVPWILWVLIDIDISGGSFFYVTGRHPRANKNPPKSTS